MPLEETKISGHRVQLRRSSRLQKCNGFSNTADDPIDLEPTQDSEINNSMEQDEQTSTPNTSEGGRTKRYKHAARKNKVKPGQNSTPDSDVYISTISYSSLLLLLPTLILFFIIILNVN